MEKILIIGAGRWGSALGVYLQKKGFQVAMLCHSLSTQNQIRQKKTSPHLPNFPFQEGVQAFLNWDGQQFSPDLLLLCTPSKFLEETLASLPKFPKTLPIMGVNKGIGTSTLQTIPEMVKKKFPENPYLHLGGPCFPPGLLEEKSFVAETLACEDLNLASVWQKKISSPTFRIYISQDVLGVALLGAVKNIFAIASGALKAIHANEEAYSILITRGLHEISQLKHFYPIQDATIYGLSGLGDLVLTCYSPSSSHNVHFGELVVQLGGAEQAVAAMGNSVAEGYTTTKALHQKIQNTGVQMPIMEAIYRFLYENQPIYELLQSLMQRPLKKE